MPEFLRPIKTTTLSDAWGLVQRHEFELRRRDGSWQRQIRETYDRGDGAAVLLCDRTDTSVILIRQFRYPAFYRGEPPYVIEVCRKARRRRSGHLRPQGGRGGDRPCRRRDGQGL